MSLLEIVHEVRRHLEESGRLSYWMLRREFSLDDDTLAKVVAELVDNQCVAVREDNALAWSAAAAPSPARAEVSPAPPARDPHSYTPQHLADRMLHSKTALEGERRQVTVLFSDVSGFTAMSEKLDPEDVRAIMDRVFELILNEVHRYEGTVNQFLGDGVMALFGVPVENDGHAQRALRAALAIQRGLQPLADEVRQMHGVEFRMRIGINTGRVVVGAIGRDLRRDYTAVGDTTNLAACLLNIAQPGQIAVSRRTQQLSAGFFVFEDLGDFEVKGMTRLVHAYAVSSEISGQTSLEVSREREQEIASTVGLHRQATDGQGMIRTLLATEEAVETLVNNQRVAIREDDAPALAPRSYTPQHLVEKIMHSKAALEGERKQVTVLFADVPGFMAVSEKLDPEEVHVIMDSAFEVILNEVHRYEGMINQFLGDGVMALFGAPVANEDHTQRALSAALAIQRGLQRLADEMRQRHGVEFRMRMGINTGLVVVGAIGRDLRMDYTAVGDTTNLAARLLGLAKPGQIVISRRVQQLSAGFFVFEELGDFQVKGKREPVRAYAVSSEISGQTRLEVSRERGLTPLVGRDQELGTLIGLHQRAADGQGAIALLVGDAGVGKSRLLYEFLHRIEAAGDLQLETTCASYGRSMAYRPIEKLLRRYLGLSEGLSGEEIRSHVAEELQFLGLEGEERAILLAHFLGVSAPPEFLRRFSSAQLKERLLGVLRDVFLGASELAPLILVVENMHWIDSASEELLAHLAAGLPGHRVLLVLTTRPGYTAAWLTVPLAQTITLEGLSTGDVQGMVRTLLAAEEVAEPLCQLLADKSEGNPLYVEEILHQLQETGGIAVENGEARLSRTDVTVPATIHDIIAARIDRIAEPLKQTLQGAAVVGRRFGVSLVSRVLQVVPEQVAGHLQDLHALDFVFPSAQDPELIYSFKHALTQDVVYGGMLERRRRQYHTAAGLGLEELYAGQINEVVELVAYHFGRGRVWNKAVTYHKQASVKAQGKSAYREAVASLEEVVEALRHLPETPETREQEIDVRIELRALLYSLGEFEKMLPYLREAEAMASAISDSRRLALVSIHTAEYCRQTGQFAEARTLAEQALALGDKLQDLPLQLYASHYLGLACHTLGDYRRASELLRAIVQSPEAERQTGALSRRMSGSRGAQQAMNLSWLARCLAELGEFEEGVDAGRRAVAIAEGPYSLAAAGVGLGYIALVRGDLDAAGPVLERAYSITREANITLFRAQSTRLLGIAYCLAGRIDDGVALVRAAADEVEAKRLLVQHAAGLVLLGEAYLLGDRVNEALTTAERALALARERGQRGDAAAALYVLSEATARGPLDIDKAEHQFLAAIALAGELEMRPLLARCHLGIGRLYVRTGDCDRAEDHLLTATRLFSAMDMPLRLRQAVSSLSELG
jgi:class 3 adenylate cyclase/tetratricopeptide (TPR) repeat protein